MIKIIDNSFNFLGEIDDYESLIFTRSYSGIGSFEMRINANKNHTDKLQNENIIFLTDKKAGVILHREIDTANQETLIVKGLTLKAYIGRRITIPPAGLAYDYKNDQAESIIKHYVTANCVTPTDIQRIFNDLIVAADQIRGGQIIYQTRLKNLAEEIEAIANISGLGWDVTLDLVNKKFVFDVYEGRDLTAGQTLLPPAIFSIDYDNISSQKLIDSKINYRNIGYVGGQGEGADRTIAVVGDVAADLARLETFIDARDISDGTDLGERGLQKLKEFAEVLAFDNDILAKSNLIYEQDFDLGDIVTAVNKKWNVTLNSRITEITEVYEPDGFKVSAVFGNDVPTLIQKIKKEIDRPLTEKNTSAGVTSYNDLTDKPVIPNETTINGNTGAIAKADIVALGIPAQDTVYTHPANHPPSIIVQDASNRFTTDAEKAAWNAKQAALGFTPATAAQGALADAALPSASYTAADVLTKVKTVDGAGSGLDADLLDGQQASAFATAAANITDHSIVRGNGGAKGIQGSGVLVDDSNNLTGIAAATLSGLLTLSAGQIKFPAAQNASADANTLDDYEEGTWTPIDSSGGGLSFSGYSTKYVKIGCLVYISLFMYYPINTDTTHYAMIGGIPFTALFNTAITTVSQSGSVVNTQLQGAQLRPYDITTGAQTNASLSGKYINISGCYPV